MANWANWALRQFVSRDLLLKQVEYGKIIWGPYDQGQINQIEQVQKRFTSKVYEFLSEDLGNPGKMRCTMNYSDRLKKLKMFPLERRRERFAIIYMYKILIKYTPSVGLEHYPHRSSHIFRTKVIPDNRPIPSWIKKVCNSSFFVKGPLL